MRENLQTLKLSELKALARELGISPDAIAGDLRLRTTWLDAIVARMETLSPKLAPAVPVEYVEGSRASVVLPLIKNALWRRRHNPNLKVRFGQSRIAFARRLQVGFFMGKRRNVANCHTTQTTESAFEVSLSSCNWHTNSTQQLLRKPGQTLALLLENCAFFHRFNPRFKPALIERRSCGYRLRLRFRQELAA